MSEIQKKKFVSIIHDLQEYVEQEFWTINSAFFKLSCSIVLEEQKLRADSQVFSSNHYVCE